LSKLARAVAAPAPEPSTRRNAHARHAATARTCREAEDRNALFPPGAISPSMASR
jgi:hypothetical protein